MERATWLERRFGASTEWLPFDLHPEYPPEGIDVAQLSARYGFDVEQHHGRLFGENGLPHATRTRIPNSRAALNVAELARDSGVHSPFHERLMTAYWAEDRDISDPDVLVEEATPFGLDADEVRDVATKHPFQERIQTLTAAVHEMGAGGVPAFVIDDRVMIPGAQPHELFEKVMQKLGIESVETPDDPPPASE